MSETKLPGKPLTNCCVYCKFWFCGVSFVEEGECRVGGPSRKAVSNWPRTYYKDWCGRHKPLEEGSRRRILDEQFKCKRKDNE
jgi:hypothetical protein